MRPIEFKGFHANENGKETIWLNGEEIKGEWVFGGYPFAQCFFGDIISETISQFVGITDLNGNKIWENDLLRDDKGQIGTVFYQSYSFAINWKMKDGSYETDTCFVGEVIGNRWQKEGVC